MRFRAEPYKNAVTGYGPYWRVLDTQSGRAANQMINGCAYPIDGIQTRGRAQRIANRLNGADA